MYLIENRELKFKADKEKEFEKNVNELIRIERIMIKNDLVN
ncbi:MAG: hypothetical protein QW685_09280 [Saccharolobus sp.]